MKLWSECVAQCFVGFVASGDPLCLLGIRPERQADLHPAGRHAGEAAQTQPQAVPPGTLLEVCRVGIQKWRTMWRHWTCEKKKTPFSPYSVSSDSLWYNGLSVMILFVTDSKLYKQYETDDFFSALGLHSLIYKWNSYMDICLIIFWI